MTSPGGRPERDAPQRRDSLAAVAYCGFSDTSNVGDYAIFKANEHLFPSFSFVPADGQAAVASLFGGGTTLPWALRTGTFKRRRLNTAIGVGVHDPAFYGSFGPLTRLALYRWRFRFLGVRGPRSQRVLTSYGIASQVTGDTALILAPAGAPRPASNRIAVSIVGEPMQRMASIEQSYEAVLDAARRLLAEGKDLVLVPFCTSDRDLMLQLHRTLGERAEFLDFWSEGTGPDLDRFLARLASCDLMIGERLHSMVLAAAMHVPFVGLAYTPKCYDFVESIGAEPFLLDCEGITGEAIAKAATDVLRRHETVSDTLRERVEVHRRALVNAAAEITGIVAG